MMCQKCVDAVKKYWPNLPEDKWDSLLWGATCFPAGEPEQVEQQLQELAEQSGCDFDKAMAIANMESEKAM